jgi:predicted Rossmann-fold nucleotide-binding protein
VILYGRGYWTEIIDFDALVRHGMIDRKDLALFQYADDPQTALALLQTSLKPEGEEAAPAFAASRTSDRTVG